VIGPSIGTEFENRSVRARRVVRQHAALVYRKTAYKKPYFSFRCGMKRRFRPPNSDNAAAGAAIRPARLAILLEKPRDP
jgi:hypothetical protein